MAAFSQRTLDAMSDQDIADLKGMIETSIASRRDRRRAEVLRRMESMCTQHGFVLADVINTKRPRGRPRKTAPAAMAAA